MWIKIKENWHILAIALVVVMLVIFRLQSYGDPTLSIGTNDSSSYFTQVDVPTFSWEALTVRRLPSYVLLFKIFEPEEGYDLQAISLPADPSIGTKNKQAQIGFDHIAINQMRLSIVSWVFFSLMVARFLKHKYLKILAVFIILSFAFAPQIAEWDSIIMSESISFSLFVIMLGLSLEVISRLIAEGKQLSLITWLSIGAWFVIFVLWAFTRDSNANTMIIPVLLFLILMVLPRVRKGISISPFIAICTLLLGLFVIYAIAAGQSGRWMGSWESLHRDFIAPYPENVQFFNDHGMPETNIREWAQENGAKTYLTMMLSKPGFMFEILFSWMEDVFSENMQPFFYTPASTGYKLMIAFGNMLHPNSSLPFPFGLISGALIVIQTFISREKEKLVWGWMAIWLVLLVYGYYGFAFFGDSAGLIRHLLGATMPMRMITWLFPIVLADLSFRKSTII